MKQTADDGRVAVDFFRGKQGKLWLTLLILSPVFAVAFAVFAFLYADDGLIVILGCCAFAAVCAIIFIVCLVTAKTRTSRWVADGEGVAYFCLGRKVLGLKWEEIREAAGTKAAAPKPHPAAPAAEEPPRRSPQEDAMLLFEDGEDAG